MRNWWIFLGWDRVVLDPDICYPTKIASVVEGKAVEGEELSSLSVSTVFWLLKGSSCWILVVLVVVCGVVQASASRLAFLSTHLRWMTLRMKSFSLP